MASNYGLLSINYGPLRGMVACCFGLPVPTKTIILVGSLLLLERVLSEQPTKDAGYSSPWCLAFQAVPGLMASGRAPEVSYQGTSAARVRPRELLFVERCSEMPGRL